MKQICKFCTDRDVSLVVPGLSVDLQSAIESGVVLDTGVVEDYNDIDSPSKVSTRVRDVFHAMDLQRAYLEAGKIASTTSLSGSMEHGNTTTSSSGVATAGE